MTSKERLEFLFKLLDHITRCEAIYTLDQRARVLEAIIKELHI